jgi:hypothetical protein
VRITLDVGNAIKAQLAATVIAVLTVDPTLLPGADRSGRVFMNAPPNPVQPGSSVSHWDPLTSPNQLMEPASSPDITHTLVPPKDLTVSLLRDIGWYPDADLDGFADDEDECDASDLRDDLFIGRVAISVRTERLPSRSWRNVPFPRCSRRTRIPAGASLPAASTSS